MTPDKNPAEPPQLEVHHYNYREVAARFWPLIRPFIWQLAAAAIAVSLVGLALAVVPLFPKYVIDTAIPAGSMRMALLAAAAFLATQWTRVTLWYFAMCRIFGFQQRVVFTLRSTGFSHLQQLCLRFHNQFPSGLLYERVFGNSINTLGNFMQLVLQQLITFVVGFLFSLGFCLYLSPPLTAVIMIGAFGYVFVARKMSKKIYQNARSSNEAHMRAVNMIMDKLRGQKTIKALSMEQTAQTEFDAELWPVMNKWLTAVLDTTRLSMMTEALSYLITAVVVVGGAWMLMDGSISGHSIGTLVAFMGYQGTLISVIGAITNVVGQFAAARSSFDQLYTVLDTTSTITDRPGAVMPADISGKLEFRDVTFSYTDRPVIKNLSLALEPGQTVAIIGRSGSGKTTLTNLLMRFYDPQSGSILLDGHDIRDLPLHDYRRMFSVVLQDPYLFDTTIANNLRYVKPDATDAELAEALKRARAWDFVNEFAEGINRKVGEAGSLLSGGQRQRLAIARCMLLDSHFVILDEATSSLDPETEMQVQEAINELFRGRTALVIAHRLSTITSADKILVFDDGRLAEQGTAQDLLAADGLFSRFHKLSTRTGGLSLRME